ncbi:MAG: TIM barrel protein [Flavisolibacter sp.]
MNHTSRRKLIKDMVLGGTAVVASPALSFASCHQSTKKMSALKNNINHSVCRWTYNFLPLEELCAVVKKIGFSAIDLAGPKDWDTMKKYGVYSSMCNGAEISLTKGWNDTQFHATLIKNYLEHIELVSQAGYKNLICFSGNRNGMSDENGILNCVEGLKKILPLAEKKGITIQMELLNSRVDHKDQMCDNTKWGIELCKRIGSPNFKLLYDIYHMQIDEGDVIRSIRNNHEYFGHYHTGGNPGRHEIDETQELYYPAIMKAILETGFKDYVAQEFIPSKENKIASLESAIRICDV